MKRLVFRLCLCCTLVLGMASTAFAGGFSINEWSARGDAQAGALIAHGDDASSMAYNPAGMTGVAGTQIMAGTAILTPYGSADIEGYGNTDADVITHFAPHIYAAHNFNDKFWFGIAEYSRFGLGTVFDNEWAGRYNSYKSDLKTFSVQPTVAYKFNDEWSVGVGLEVMYGSVEIRKRLGMTPGIPAADVGDAAVSGSGLGFGGILGVQYKPLDWLSFGLTGRTPVNLDLRGNLEVEKVGAGSPGLRYGTFYGSTTLNLPGSVGIGVAVKPIEDLTIEVDYLQTFWSSYNKLDLEYDDEGIEQMYGAGVQKSWRNVSRIQVGAEYSLTENWDLRAGYVWDEAPNVANFDYLLFPGNKQIASAGVGFKWEGFTVDASYAYLWGQDVTGSVPYSGGSYETDFNNVYANLINITFGYEF